MQKHALKLLNSINGTEDLDESQVALHPMEKEIKQLDSDLETQRLESDIDKLVDEQEHTTELQQELAETVTGIEMLMSQPNRDMLSIGLLYTQANKLHCKLGGGSKLPINGMESLDVEKLKAYVIVGQESFMDTLKGVAEGTAEFFRRIWEMLKKLFNDWRMGEARVKKARDELVKLVNEKELKEKITYAKAWGWLIHDDKRHPIPNGKYRGEYVHGFIQSIMDSIIKLWNDTPGPEEIVVGCAELQKDLIRELNSLPKKVTGDVTTYNVGGIMTVRFITKPISNEDTALVESIKMLDSLRVRFEFKPSEPYTETDVKFDKKFLLDTLSGVDTILKKVEQSSKNAKKNEDACNKLIKETQIPDIKSKMAFVTCFKALANTTVVLENAHIQYLRNVINAQFAMVKAHLK